MADTLRPWPIGEATIRQLIQNNRLERVPGNPEYTNDLIDRCQRKLISARAIVEDDPESAYLVTYDAARFLLTALLAAQGLRPKGGPEGGHVTVQEAAAAQFPGEFAFFGRMRRTRNELEYPPLTKAAATVDTAEATERIAKVNESIAPVRALVHQLPKFT